ncbi:hypothetical protein FRY74_06290 [Vicingus serpentipes]|uniref:Uncharacterized protein n=1 Tax=Vicingus serpentipes TaxID=1926625 RepID=A0A5C6RUY8_9FLAO|nr:hypothetical protein [Vicingus serpentipes]TXB66178.1 hypothetical protein FRY74_06290 [Vicingus serpentipes]
MKPSIKELECIRIAKKFKPKRNKLLTFFKHENIDVSSIKTFSQLWRDHGLGYGFFTLNDKAVEEKIKCINLWVQVLYTESIDVCELIDKIKKDNIKSKIKFEKDNPGGHQLMQNPIDSLILTIDNMIQPYT